MVEQDNIRRCKNCGKILQKNWKDQKYCTACGLRISKEKK